MSRRKKKSHQQSVLLSQPLNRRPRILERVLEASRNAPSGTAISALLLCVFLFLYFPLSYLSSSTEYWWALDSIHSIRIFFLDDAYRYFSIRQAVHSLSVPAWSYLLPGQILFDGILIRIFDANLVLVRVAHAALAIVALRFLWVAMIRQGIGQAESLMSLLVLSLMPLFIFVMLSFYGEAWLALSVIAMLYGLSAHNYLVLSLAAGLAPLFRPEGIMYVPFVLLYLLRVRQFKCAALLVVPGFIYALHVLVSLNSLQDYVLWRFEMRKLYGRVMMDGQFLFIRDPFGYMQTYSFFWLPIAVAAAFCLPVCRGWWPVLGGGGLFLLYTTLNVILGTGEYEARYLVSVLPILAVCWAAALSWLRHIVMHRLGNLSALTVTLVVPLWVISSHVLQSDILREYVVSILTASPDGRSSLYEHVPRARPGVVSSLEDAANVVHILTSPEVPAKIDRVLISTSSYDVFYRLDPARIRQDVIVAFSPSGEAIFNLIREGEPLFSTFPQGRQYEHLFIQPPDLHDQKLLLYFGELPMAFSPGWIFDLRKVYLLSYRKN